MNPIKVMGLDLSIAETGIAVIGKQDFGGTPIFNVAMAQTIKTNPRHAYAARLAVIADSLWAALESMKPDKAILEAPFIHREHPRGSIPLFGVHGVVKLLLYRAGVPYKDTLSPKELKKWIAGHGGADKAEVVNAINGWYSFTIDNHNVAEAIGLALWGLGH